MKKLDRPTVFVLKLFGVGFIATLVRAAALFALSVALPVPVRMSAASGLYFNQNPLVLMHLLFVNDIVFAILYGAIFMPGVYLIFRELFRFNSILKGLLLGSGLWLISELMLLPLHLFVGNEPEFPARWLILAGNLVALEIYGICLAWGIDSVEPQRHERRHLSRRASAA